MFVTFLVSFLVSTCELSHFRHLLQFYSSLFERCLLDCIFFHSSLDPVFIFKILINDIVKTIKYLL